MTQAPVGGGVVRKASGSTARLFKERWGVGGKGALGRAQREHRPSKQMGRQLSGLHGRGGERSWRTRALVRLPTGHLQWTRSQWGLGALGFRFFVPARWEESPVRALPLGSGAFPPGQRGDMLTSVWPSGTCPGAARAQGSCRIHGAA